MLEPVSAAAPAADERGVSGAPAPSLPKGGGTVSIGGGMLSAGGPDGAAGWQLPLPSPKGRSLSAELTLQYSSAGGNGPFGAGWDCPLPAVLRMTRFGFPKYDGNDRMVGPNGQEILRGGSQTRRLPFWPGSPEFQVTFWWSRFGSRAECLQHWTAPGQEKDAGFWVHKLADGSLSLYGWSARLRDPLSADRVAGWYLEETVSRYGEHVVYRYREENEQGCDGDECAAHPGGAHLYLSAVYSKNVSPSFDFLLPRSAFDEAQFKEFTLFDYGERGADPCVPPVLETDDPWPVRADRHSFWRYGFEVRIRRLCRDVLLWRRMGKTPYEEGDTPVLVERLHLKYTSSSVTSLLESVQQITYDAHTRMPPLEFQMTLPGRGAPRWEAMPALEGFWEHAWQLVDLFGEGVPGLLYKDRDAWMYRRPQRLTTPIWRELTPVHGGPWRHAAFQRLEARALAQWLASKPGRVALKDAITWGPPQLLPLRPCMNGTLADLDGDGRLEWLVTGSVRGSITLNPDGQWSAMTPLTMPAELGHPQARLADLTGNGLQDVVLLPLGPRTVRVYPANGKAGWSAAVIQQYQGNEPLPSLAASELQLVAFADPCGSGQQHLLRITGQGVTLWPSLGYGNFAEAVAIPGFAVDRFNASRVWLADTDGAGTTDILYLEPERIRVFVSQCGNRYVEGDSIPAPPGVLFDATCQLQVADIRGQGTADLLLTVPHGGPNLRPRSWLFRFNDRRPWLLEQVVDNAGSRTLLEYRSSAQAWLDEKAAAGAGTSAVSYLPFPVHTVSRVTTVNDITGLCLGSETTYLGGVWDPEEREFAGFARLVQIDSHERSATSAAELSPPMRTCTWFYTGLEAHDGSAQGAFSDMDKDFAPDTVRFTRWTAQGEQDDVPVPGSALRAWLYRAVRGQVMRTEVYGQDGAAGADRPYSVSRQRLQVRAYAMPDPQHPVAQVSTVQALSFVCERITEDPQIAQTLTLQADEYGNPLASVAVHYPRQLTETDLATEENERRYYPQDLPEGLIVDSLDPQQYTCWLNLTRTSLHNLVAGDDFVIGLPDATRRDVIRLQAGEVPKQGFTVEGLADFKWDEPSRTTFAGYEKVIWRKADGTGVSNTPSRQALKAYTRTAMLDKAALDALRPTFTQTLRQLVRDGLETPDTATDMLERMRLRVPCPPTLEVLYALVAAYAPVAAKDGAACEAMRGALKTVIAVQALQRRLLAAEAAELPSGLQARLHEQSRVPDEHLWAVMAWYLAAEGAGGTKANSLYKALAEALYAARAQALFWRIVLWASESLEVALPAAKQWLREIDAELDGRVQEESLEALLKRGGYVAMNRPPEDEELEDPHDPDDRGAPGIPWGPAVEEAYCGHHGITEYLPAGRFWLPARTQDSTLVGPSELRYSTHDIAVQAVIDAAGLTTLVEAYDWRFGVPVRIKDPNDNTHEVELDALGRVMSTRFYGTETPGSSERPVKPVQPVAVGYSKDKAFLAPLSVDAAVALNASKQVPVAEAFTYVADTWMPWALRADGSVDLERRCGALAWQRDAQRLRKDGIAPRMSGQAPPHVIHVQTDRYDPDPEQQVRVAVLLNGGGQVLQSARLNPPGKAFVRTEAGGLQTDDQGRAVLVDAPVRWAVSGKTEYDNKGQAVRQWLPFYLDDWRWVGDDSAREGIYADTHVYDALGREIRIIRANGEQVGETWANYEHRTQLYPWFTVVYDENDTWAEVIERAGAGS
ncbi:MULTISPECIES: SpvB/TcaC N-terminal domain-containing protein [unclassified Pseudomonas]|uniref:SpvB/TcaC N-terminal domain-containing protein n=1 Tax=unclassified Pseudomonas TaxID=196821 RepID=UPI002097D697|nr:MULTISPECIES: SpvB/TcaC N-terminal domain-containing protein [unclassified Pseudomonas]MCO7520853.1 hypothetical protein [Pseudomonas sp. 1]MCO7542762.1 hypothetical protein [Pseudomonas sp. VA159-2]